MEIDPLALYLQWEPVAWLALADFLEDRGAPYEGEALAWRKYSDWLASLRNATGRCVEGCGGYSTEAVLVHNGLDNRVRMRRSKTKKTIQVVFNPWIATTWRLTGKSRSLAEHLRDKVLELFDQVVTLVPNASKCFRESVLRVLHLSHLCGQTVPHLFCYRERERVLTRLRDAK